MSSDLSPGRRQLFGALSTSDYLQEDVKIVLLTEKFTPEIAQIELESFPAPWSEEMIRDELRKTTAFYLGALSGEDLVAYCGCNVAADELHILNIAVRPSWRRRGLGKLMLEKAMRYASQKGAKQAFLEVRPSNTAARELYRKVGFVQRGVRRAYYRDTGEDALELEREIF